MTAYRISDPEIEDAIERHFVVHDSYFYLDAPRYTVTPMEAQDPQASVKAHFEALVGEVRPHGHLPFLTKDGDKYQIELKRIRQTGPRSNRRNLYLFIATLATVFFDGYLRSNNPVLTEIMMPDTPVYMNALMFTVAIIAIFGFHELGHKAATILRGVDASMPYFIPAPPGMGGTFGAVITQGEPPTNRDALFDLGLSGPLVGFIVTILVTIVGLRLSFVVPLKEVNGWMTMFPEIRFQSIPFPLILDWLSTTLRPVWRPHQQVPPQQIQSQEGVHSRHLNPAPVRLFSHGYNGGILHDAHERPRRLAPRRCLTAEHIEEATSPALPRDDDYYPRLPLPPLRGRSQTRPRGSPPAYADSGVFP